MKKKKSAIPVRVSAWLEIWNRSTQSQRKDGKEQRKQRAKRAGKTARKPLLISSWRSTQEKKKTSPQRVVFVNNCIVFKVQEFMYKRIQLCWPQHPKENRRTEERHKLWGGEWEKQNTELREWIYRETWMRAIKKSGAVLNLYELRWFFCFFTRRQETKKNIFKRIIVMS